MGSFRPRACTSIAGVWPLAWPLPRAGKVAQAACASYVTGARFPPSIGSQPIVLNIAYRPFRLPAIVRLGDHTTALTGVSGNPSLACRRLHEQGYVLWATAFRATGCHAFQRRDRPLTDSLAILRACAVHAPTCSDGRGRLWVLPYYRVTETLGHARVWGVWYRLREVLAGDPQATEVAVTGRVMGGRLPDVSCDEGPRATAGAAGIRVHDEVGRGVHVGHRPTRRRVARICA
jgi:hypothetical protein